MPPEKLANYLLSHRKRLGLSQDDVAFLLCCDTGSMVSQYECGVRYPTVENVLAFEVVLGVPARVLFAGVFEAVQGAARKRALVLIRQLERKDRNPRVDAKLTALRAIVGLAEARRANGGDA